MHGDVFREALLVTAAADLDDSDDFTAQVGVDADRFVWSFASISKRLIWMFSPIVWTMVARYWSMVRSVSLEYFCCKKCFERCRVVDRLRSLADGAETNS